MLSLVCRLTDSILATVSEVSCELIVTRSGNKDQIFQNLTNLSLDAEMREGEENIRDLISSAWPTKVSTRWGSGLVISQT